MVVSSAQILKHKGSLILMVIVDGGEATHRRRRPQNWCEQTIKLQLRIAVVFTVDSAERRFHNHASRQIGWRIGRVGSGEEDQLRDGGLEFKFDANVSDFAARQRSRAA